MTGDDFKEILLVGMLNGFAKVSGKDFWIAEERWTPDQVFSWMDSYCEENSLGRISDGAVFLMDERVGPDWLE
jgi:hypothetical protein